MAAGPFSESLRQRRYKAWRYPGVPIPHRLRWVYR